MLSTNVSAITIDVHTLSQVFEHIESAVVVANLEREIVSLNKAALNLFGYASEEIVGRSTRVLYANESDFIDLGLQRFNVQASESDESFNVSYRTALGSLVHAHTTSGFIKDSEGRTNYFVAIITDDSARIAAEETLNRLHSITSSRQLTFDQRVRAILELGAAHFGLPIGIFSKITDNQYLIQQAIHPDDFLEPGMTFELGNTYCSHVFKANDVEGFHHASKSHIATHPCFLNFGLEAYLGAPIFVDGERYGTLNFSSPKPTAPFITQDREIVRLFAEWVGHEIARENDLHALESAHAKLEVLASTDALTGLANRGCTDQYLHQLLLNNKSSNQSFVLAILDFDHFKQINDQYGHHVGDECLVGFADIFKTVQQDELFIGRWGGEEFLAIFTNHSDEQATRLIENVMEQLKHKQVSKQVPMLKLTLSVGLTRFQPGDTELSLLARADELLYKAKNDGRDQIVFTQ